MKILVVGGGGREHALVWRIGQSPLIGSREDILCVPGNAGIEGLATCLPAPVGGLSNVGALVDLAEKHRVDLTVIGPELPLTLGVADELDRRGMPVFGPSRAAARLEGSKAFAKEFMSRHGIPTASYQIFTSCDEALGYLDAQDREYPIVVKADGLAAGKGVVVAQDRETARNAVRMLMEERRHGAAGERVVIEECLTGTEVSFFAITDGEKVVPLASCQDYKRALDGDDGANTGGMGAYSPSIEVDAKLEAEIMERVMVPTVRGLAAEGSPYRGVLYAGLMLTRGERAVPMTLEFNVRFGDPETQVLMRRIAGDLVPVMAGVGNGHLDDSAVSIQCSPQWAACVVMASRGYPASSESGRPITGIEEAEQVPGTVVFHAGTRRAPEAERRSTPVTAGGRVLAVSSAGADLKEAVERAYQGIERIQFEGMQFRRDIGRSAMARLSSRQGV